MEPKYRAFISYSHAADGRLAPALQTALQQFAKPLYQLRSIRVFRDETGLGVTPALWPAIQDALNASDYFILLASPAAAESKWVHQEVDWWRKHRPVDHLLIGWTDGKLTWANDDYDWGNTDALPRNLEHVFPAEPKHSDLRFAKSSTDLSMRNANFLMEVAKFSSVLRGRSLDELIGADVREHRKAKRLAWSAASALFLFFVWAVCAAAVAVHERNVASQQRKLALERGEQSRQRLLQIYDNNGQSLIEQRDLSGSLLWFAEALKSEEGHPQGEDLQRIRMASVMRQHPVLNQVWGDDVERSSQPRMGFTQDGDFVVVERGGNAAAWNTRSGIGLNLSKDNKAEVFDLALKDKRRWVLTGGTDEAARVLDAESGKVLVTLKHDGMVNWATFSADAERIVTASADRTARVWDTATGKELISLPHEEVVDIAVFGADGQHVVTLSGEKTVRVWDIRTGKSVLLKNTVRTWAELSPDSQRVLTINTDAAAGLWNAETGDQVSSLGDWAWVDGGKFSPDGKRLVIVSRNGWARVWDLAEDKEVVTVQHKGAIIDASFSSDGRLLATASTDQTVRIWDIQTGAQVNVSLAHGDTVDAVAFSPDGKRLATRTAQGLVRIWHLEGSAEMTLRHDRSVRRACFSKDAKRLLTTTDFAARIWDLETQTPISLKLETQLYYAAFSPDGLSVVTGTEDGKARLFDARTGTLVRSMRHSRRVENLDFGRDGKRLVTASDMEICVWDLAGGTKLKSMRHDAPVVYVEFDNTGNRILAVDFDAMARVWDATTGRAFANLQRSNVNVAAFSPDGKYVATADESSLSLNIWDAVTGAAVAQTIRQDGRIISISFSPDSQRVAMSDESSGAARVWNAQTGTAVTAPLQHGNRVLHVSFSLDGKKLVTASVDKTARVWDAATGSPLSYPLAHDGVVRYAEFSPDGLQVATAGEDDSAKVWNLSGDRSSLKQLETLACLLSARRIDETGAMVPLRNREFLDLWSKRLSR